MGSYRNFWIAIYLGVILRSAAFSESVASSLFVLDTNTLLHDPSSLYCEFAMQMMKKKSFL